MYATRRDERREYQGGWQIKGCGGGGRLLSTPLIFFACVHESIAIAKNPNQTPMPTWQQDWIHLKKLDGVV
jgi:hypothetical protein